MRRNRIKLVSILCTIIMVATVFSVAVKNVSACGGGCGEEDIESLNPDVTTDGYTHIVWQENLTGNFEVYYANNATGNYENTLRETIYIVENLTKKSDSELQPTMKDKSKKHHNVKPVKDPYKQILKELNKALEYCLEKDYKHSMDRVHEAVKGLEKAGNTELITSLIDSIRDFAKTNILYVEYNLTINNSYIQKAWQKYYLAVKKYEQNNYDAAIEQFKNSYLKVLEAWEEAYEEESKCENNDDGFVGIDFGEIVRISYTGNDSMTPTIYLNGTIHVSWTEIIGNTTHIYYARSYNGISWWYFDVTKQASTYLLYWDIDLKLINFGILPNIRDFLKDIMKILERIWIWIICHRFWGILRDGTYAPISDPLLDKYPPYTTVYACGRTIHVPGCEEPPPEPPPDGDGDKAVDLTVWDILPTPSYDGYLFTDEANKIYATVYNQGDASAVGIKVRFWDNGVQIDADITIDYLDPKEFKYAVMPWVPSAGTHSIRVMVDPDNAILDEGNEFNNEKTISVVVFDPEGDDDEDLLNNYDEVMTYGTEPLNPDTDGDGSYDGVEIHFPGTSPLQYQTLLVMKDASGNPTQLIYPYTGWSVTGNYEIKKANGNEPSWAPLAKELAPILIYEDMNQEFPTSIFFDENRNMADNGKPGYWPDGSTYDSVGGTRNGINTGYYTKTNQQKRDMATVYINALIGDNLIGIQYWFYYVFHDDPSAEYYKHDWWYFWIVYDTSTYTPTATVYDFHHNLRVKDWSWISKEGFHPKVWVDAGGHHGGLYGSGVDISLATAGDIYDTNLAAQLENDGTPSNDEIFGAMIKRLYYQGSESEYGSKIADWRYVMETDYSLYGVPIDAPVGKYDEGPTSTHRWDVKDFPHWIYVYEVDDTIDARDSFNQPVHKVGFTYTGNPFNIPTGTKEEDGINYWPIHDGTDSTNLPWTSGKSVITGTTLRSSPELVWKWWAYNYMWDGTPYPSAITRYFDGSW